MLDPGEPRLHVAVAHEPRTNIQRYPEWTAYLKDQQPKTLIVWGRNDPLMRPAAAEFLKQVVPAADRRFFDASHFALDENADAIAEAIIQTFAGDDERAGAVPRRSLYLRSPGGEFSS